MDIYIKITDEDGELLESVNIYQDGSDSEGASEIRDWLEENYSTDPSQSSQRISHARLVKALGGRIDIMRKEIIGLRLELRDRQDHEGDTECPTCGQYTIKNQRLGGAIE